MAQVYWGLHGALNASANPAALFLGDSWFWYPLDNLATEIGASFPNNDFLVIGRNGGEATEWATKTRKDIDLAFKFYASGVQAFFLSGGGNDIAGSNDFLRLLQDYCSKAKSIEECYRVAQPEELITQITGAYRSVITKFRAYNTSATVFMHNYDNAWPTGKGLFGPADWLKVPMDKAKVPKDLRRPLFKDLLARLRKVQLELAKDKSLGPLVAIESAGTFPESDPDSWWANELHPTPKGFRLLAKNAFRGPVKKAIVA